MRPGALNQCKHNVCYGEKLDKCGYSEGPGLTLCQNAKSCELKPQTAGAETSSTDASDGPAPLEETVIAAPSNGDYDAKTYALTVTDYVPDGVTVLITYDPGCSMVKKFINNALTKLIPEFGTKMNVYFADFPLGLNPLAIRQSAELHCAQDLNQQVFRQKFVEFLAHSNEASWETGAFSESFRLDEAELKACVENPDSSKKVLYNHDFFSRRGFEGTPTVVIDGKIASNNLESSREALDASIHKIVLDKSVDK